MKPSLIIFQVEASRRKEGSPATSFCLFQMWCQIFTEVDLKSISWISSPLWEAPRRDGCTRHIRRRMLYQNLTRWNERVEFSQRMHFLYRSFYVNMKNQHFFSWSCCYLKVLSKWLFSLSIRVHALWMCYNEQSLYLYLGGNNCPRISKSKQRPSPAELVWNQFDMALTSMYTKVLTEWDETKRSTKCWQRNMSQYSLLPVTISFVRIYHPMETFSVFSCAKCEEAPLLQIGFAWLGSSVSM